MSIHEKETAKRDLRKKSIEKNYKRNWKKIVVKNPIQKT